MGQQASPESPGKLPLQIYNNSLDKMYYSWCWLFWFYKL